MEVDDAHVAAQEAKALVRQGPTSVPAELSTCSGGVLPSERSSQESLETWVLLTWMLRETTLK